MLVQLKCLAQKTHAFDQDSNVVPLSSKAMMLLLSQQGRRQLILYLSIITLAYSYALLFKK